MTADYDIKLFGMGGTIDKVVYSYDHFNYVVAEPQAEGIIGASNVAVRIAVESVVKKDSLELTQEDRDALFRAVSAEPCSRIIITHGTDTVPETAKTLAAITGKTVIFTGAMLPARFVDSDASFNIGGAIIAAQILPVGQYLIMHGKVFDPLCVVKDRVSSTFRE